MFRVQGLAFRVWDVVPLILTVLNRDCHQGGGYYNPYAGHLVYG